MLNIWGDNFMKKLTCLLLTIVIVFSLLFSSCNSAPQEISENSTFLTYDEQVNATEQINAFYDAYVAEDWWHYLFYNNYEQILENGVPYYVLRNWGIEYIEYENYDSATFSFDDYAYPEEIESIRGTLLGTSLLVFEIDDIQGFMDSMFGIEIFDVSTWVFDAFLTNYIITEKGYMLVSVFPTGFIDDSTWYGRGEITFDGEYAILPLYGICYDVNDSEHGLYDLASIDYQGFEGEYYRSIALQLITEVFANEFNYDATFYEILEIYDIDINSLGAINLVFKITDTGIYLVDCGPDVYTPPYNFYS